MEKKLLLIFNPKAGKAAIKKDLMHILEYYTAKGFLVTVHPTQCSGDAQNYMATLQESYDLIVAAGGDGTINEVVTGMVLSGKTHVLGYLPVGSTNDFGAGIGVRADHLEQALNTSVNGRLVALDVGRLNERYFIYVAAFGLFTDVPYTTPQSMKNTLGYAAYILKGVQAITELKAIPLTIEHKGGRETGNFAIGLITNSMQVSGFKNPSAAYTQLNDGLMECLFIRMPSSIFELNGIIAALLSGNIVNCPLILSIQTDNLHITGRNLSWTLDGEYGGTYDDMQISIAAKRMLMRVFDDGNLEDKLLLPEWEETGIGL